MAELQDYSTVSSANSNSFSESECEPGHSESGSPSFTLPLVLKEGGLGGAVVEGIDPAGFSQSILL